MKVIDIMSRLHESYKIKNQNLKQLKFNHDSIIEKLTSKQYFQWQSKYFKGDLDFKALAVSILKVSKSKRVKQLVDIQVKLYDSMFGHNTEVIQLRKVA